MKPATRKAFEKIAKSAVLEAETVKCSFTDFVAGLDIIVQAVKDRFDMASDEAAHS